MKHNFSAGPAILPASVIENASKAVLNFDGSGLSILEISHRSSQFQEVMEQAVQHVRDLLGVGNEFEVLFLSGGASTQFFMTAMNLLDPSGTAAYVDTGAWSNKAIKEAERLANVEVVASSEDRKYSYIPRNINIPAGPSYLHITTNNTIFGTQYKEVPDVRIPLVCDMSSDIFSRELPMDRIGLLYAGAQKNMGPAGTTLVVIRKDFLKPVSRSMPSMLSYNTHIDKGSMYNTPPVFPIFVTKLYLDWAIKMGGVVELERKNTAKATILYEEIDSNPCFEGTAEEADRSMMNVCFLTTSQEYDQPFLKMCENNGIVGIKGHRSVGGFRASLYNAMPISSVEVLVETMREFARTRG